MPLAIRSLWLGLLLSLVFIPARAGEGSSPEVASEAPAQDPVEEAYIRLMEQDDEALAEIDRWIQEEDAQRNQGSGPGDVTLKARIQERIRPVTRAYEAFLEKHPDHARAHLAYGSFLMELGEESRGVQQMEKSRALDPTNPAAWNNLANHYGHRGPVSKAFEYYAKALELNPKEPVYYQNLAVCVYLFRRDAEEFYDLKEPEVFEKALGLYRKAMELDPANFVLATDYASSFYGMLPHAGVPETEKQDRIQSITARAIPAWEHTLALASDSLQREGVLIHLARNKFIAGRYTDARADLTHVTNEVYQAIRRRILRNIDDREGGHPPGAQEDSESPAQD